MKEGSTICRIIYDRVVLIRVSAVKRHNDHSNFYKGNTFSWSGLHFHCLVHYPHGVTGCHKGSMVLETELRFLLHLDLQATGSDLSQSVCLEHIWNLKARLHSETLPPTKSHLFQ